MTWKLKAISGAFDGEEVLVDQEKLLGRDPASVDVVLQGGRISRRHAKLFLQDDQLWVKDLNSANGTYVNGGRVEGEQQLHAGDALQLDVVHFVVVREATAAAETLPVDAVIAEDVTPVADVTPAAEVDVVAAVEQAPAPAPAPAPAAPVQPIEDKADDAGGNGTPVKLIAAIIAVIILAILMVVFAAR